MSFLSRSVDSITNFGTSSLPNKCCYQLHEGSNQDEQLLSHKGAHLCEITRMGLLTPPTFIISTECSLKCFNLSTRNEISSFCGKMSRNNKFTIILHYFILFSF
jgi:hypothetical protein